MENKSGVQPVEYKCLVKVFPEDDKVEDKSGFYKSKSTKIIYQSAQKEREEQGKMVGIFIASGGIAFTGDNGAPPWPKYNIPKPGQWILFDRYGGCLLDGMDGEQYRLISDKEIGAIVEVGYGRG